MEQIRFERIRGDDVPPGPGQRAECVCLSQTGISKKYAFFATNYGGMDLRFQLDGTWHDTPAGWPTIWSTRCSTPGRGNALQQLTANGASPNAFTSNAITGYYFESTEHFEENLRTLLSFVSVPYFTREAWRRSGGSSARRSA